MARQQNPHLLGDWKLVIVGGTAYTDDYADELKHAARGDNSVVFTGSQHGQTLAELFANAGLFVHPSENEGLPIAVLQAMSFGKPALVSDISEHKELILDSNFWFANGNIISLARKIIALVSDGYGLAKAGAVNRAMAQNFNWNDIADKTVKLYGSKENAAEYETASA